MVYELSKDHLDARNYFPFDKLPVLRLSFCLLVVVNSKRENLEEVETSIETVRHT